MFICTANLTDTIQPAFLDRMEVIRLSGYTEDEKLEIAKRHLVPKQLEEHGLTPENLLLTRQGAARDHQQLHARGRAAQPRARDRVHLPQGGAQGGRGPAGHDARSRPPTLHKYLGAPKILPEEILKKDAGGHRHRPGLDGHRRRRAVHRGHGHEGQGPAHPHRLTSGDVMKESAQAALSYARTRARQFGIKEDFFATHDLHVHVPEGAIPKDGPSAGITIATAMLSVFTEPPGAPLAWP